MKGLSAYHSGDYPKAMGLFERALDIGELNILYLNLARTYQRLGRCIDAELVFRKALLAPPVVDPPAEKVRPFIARFRAEQKDVCYGKLILQCDLDGMRARLNNESEIPCDGAPQSVPPGPYEIEAVWRDLFEPPRGHPCGRMTRAPQGLGSVYPRVGGGFY